MTALVGLIQMSLARSQAAVSRGSWGVRHELDGRSAKDAVLSEGLRRVRMPPSIAGYTAQPESPNCGIDFQGNDVCWFTEWGNYRCPVSCEMCQCGHSR